MIIQIQANISERDLLQLKESLTALGCKSTEVKTQSGHYLVSTDKGQYDIRSIGLIPGVKDVHKVSDQYKLVSSKWKINPTVIDLGDDVRIGDGSLSIMAGPCSIENEEQIIKVLNHLKENGIKIMRGGVYKPRSSPYSFRGLGNEGLKLWYELAQPFGIKIISEVMEVAQIESMHDYVDIFQIGARNTQNFNLLDELGKVDKPVMIKRGISGTIDELLYSAEYIFSAGNENILLCERGIRTYETASRNTFDINAIPILKQKSHLPVVADPSHGIGIRSYVEPIALASVMAGADAIIYETHEVPEKAFSDGQQTLDFEQSQKLVKKLRKTFELRAEFAEY